MIFSNPACINCQLFFDNSLSESVSLFYLQVPASVRVRRESAAPKSKPKPSNVTVVNGPETAPAVTRQESSSTSSAPKSQSIDDSYMAFLEDMKALGALDSWADSAIQGVKRKEDKHWLFDCSGNWIMQDIIHCSFSHGLTFP